MNKETKHKSRYQRSYFGPILLIAVGVLFLGSNLNLIPGSEWGVIWKLWPLLLIVAGLDDLFRRKGIAWPILLIGVGGFLLYNNFGPQSWISWTQLFQLWPVLLVAVVIDVLFRDQSGWMIAVGVILTVGLIGGAVWLFSSGGEIPANYTSVKELYPAEVENAEIDLSLGMGELALDNLHSARILIEGSITPEVEEAGLRIKGNTVVFQLNKNRPGFYPGAARWELGITDMLPVDLSVNNGVGELFLDLAEMDLESLDANQAVGRLIVKMPESAGSKLLVKQAIGSIVIQIPSEAQVAIDAQNGLTKTVFPADFELENGYYSSPGATKSNADLLIVVEQAIGLVTVEYTR